MYTLKIYRMIGSVIRLAMQATLPAILLKMYKIFYL